MKIFKKISVAVLVTAFTLGLAGVVATSHPAYAAQPTVNLGTATSFAILAGAGITNIPTSVITGNVGLSPAAGGNYAGLTQTEVTGTIYAVDGAGPGGSVNNPGLLTTAKNDLTAAYTDASGRTPATVLSGGDNQLGGQTLTPGVYSFSHATTANLTAASPLTLNGDGVYIFQASSDLITASASSVVLAGGAQACNVFWTVPSSGSSLGTDSSFVGTIMAYSSLNLMTGASLQGRALAETAAVTLDHNTITVPTCTGGGGASSVVPGLPNAGIAPNESSIAWNIIIPAGLLTVTTLLYVARRKQLI